MLNEGKDSFAPTPSADQGADQGALEAAFSACPHLGVNHDRDTHYLYATSLNRCYVRPVPVRVDTAHQDYYCLSPQHTACPRLTKAQPTPTSPTSVDRSHSAPIKAVQVPGREAGAGRRWVIGALVAICVVLSVLFLVNLAGVVQSFQEQASKVVSAPVAISEPTVIPSPQATVPAAAPAQTTVPTAAPAQATVPAAAPAQATVPAAAPAQATRVPSSYAVVATVQPASTAVSSLPTRGLTPSASVLYVVKSGDTLWSIARSYGVTIDDIVKANSLLTDRTAIVTGQRLVIPNPRTSP